MAVAPPPKRLIVEVSESLWEEAFQYRGREDTDTDKQLMDGKTLFIEGNVSSYYQRADARGYKQSARKTTYENRSGSLVKWEKKKNGNNESS